MFRVNRETDICHVLSSKRDTRVREYDHIARCTRRYTHTEYISIVCVYVHAESIDTAHCLNHQFAKFMRGFNDIIGLAGAINVL